MEGVFTIVSVLFTDNLLGNKLFETGFHIYYDKQTKKKRTSSDMLVALLKHLTVHGSSE